MDEKDLEEMETKMMSLITDDEKAALESCRDVGDKLVEELGGDDEEKQAAIAEAISIIGVNLGTIMLGLELNKEQMMAIIDHVLTVNEHATKLADKYGPLSKK